ATLTAPALGIGNHTIAASFEEGSDADPSPVATTLLQKIVHAAAPIDEVSVLVPTNVYSVPNPTVNAAAITTGPDGRLWFTAPASNEIGAINPTTGAVTDLTIPTARSNPGGITAGPDGDVWFTETYVNRIGRIDPTTDTITELTIPTSGSAPEDITVGPD